jgi:hypothetical protein
MALLTLILLIAAFVCFLLAAFDARVRRINLVGLGLALWVLVSLNDAFAGV